MIDLERELRATLEEDAQHAPPAPDARAAIRRTRRGQVAVVLAALALLAAVVAGSLAGVSALVRSSGRLIPAHGFCPPGSTPNEPGPVDQARPETAAVLGNMAFDRSSGQMILMTSAGSMWAFDVCTNTWEAQPVSPAAPQGAGDLIYDSESDLTVAFFHGRAWAYDLDRHTWTRGARGGPEGATPTDFEAVYDPSADLILVRGAQTSVIWSYDVDTDTWAEIDQGGTPPPADPDHWGPEFLAYDASVDRLILYQENSLTGPTSTWEFDLAAHRWTDRETGPGGLGWGWGWDWGWHLSNDLMVYDEANQVSVLFNGPRGAGYDASTGRWRMLVNGQTAPVPDGALDNRSGLAMAYDAVNGRLVRYGGNGAPDDVWAFDVATGELIRLLAPSES